VDVRSLRRRYDAIVRNLDLPVPFDVRALAADLAARRGRPLILSPVVKWPGPSGLWVASPAADYIFYEQATSALHQQHIILHELSHLLCGHTPVTVAETGVPRLLFPGIRPDAVERLLRRTGYSATDEQEAELVASLIWERAAAQAPAEDAPAAPVAGGVLGGLEVCLEGVPGGGPRGPGGGRVGVPRA
jgi:hypothetical protein